MFIRRAELADADDLARLNGIVQQLHFEERPDWFKPPDLEAFLPVVEGWLTSDHTVVFVASCDDGELVGYGVGIIHTRRDNPLVRGALIVELDQIVVAEQWRRAGVGTLLSDAVVDWARSEDVDRVELSTWAFNTTTQALFEDLGFEPTSIRMMLPLRSS